MIPNTTDALGFNSIYYCSKSRPKYSLGSGLGSDSESNTVQPPQGIYVPEASTNNPVKSSVLGNNVTDSDKYWIMGGGGYHLNNTQITVYKRGDKYYNTSI